MKPNRRPVLHSFAKYDLKAKSAELLEFADALSMFEQNNGADQELADSAYELRQAVLEMHNKLGWMRRYLARRMSGK